MFNFLKPRHNMHVVVGKHAPFTGPVGPMGTAGARGPQGEPGPMPTYRPPKFTPTKDAPKGHPMPQRAHDLDAGYDLTSDISGTLMLAPHARVTIGLGVSVRLDPATCGLILPRSGNAAKRGLNVITGVVDAGYTGELKVTIHNTTAHHVFIEPGTRVAQFVTIPVVTGGRVTKDGARGAAGFGSTGTAEVVGGGNKTELARYARRSAATHDAVNHPPHYTLHPVFTGECHDYAKYMTFDQGNAFKYLWRCAAKGDMRENIRKAVWYLKAMRTGPVLARRGNRLDGDKVARLEAEVAAAMDNTNRDTAPTKYMAALACYSAAALVAVGDVDNALEVAEHALDRLNGVK